jgi:hypothetical protein
MDDLSGMISSDARLYGSKTILFWLSYMSRQPGDFVTTKERLAYLQKSYQRRGKEVLINKSGRLRLGGLVLCTTALPTHVFSLI